MPADMKDHDPIHDSMGLPVTPAEPGKRFTFVGYLRSRLITGILVALPLVITLFFGRFLYRLLDSWSYPLSARVFGYTVPGIGAVLALLLIFVLGELAHSVVGRRVLRGGESAIARIPVVRSVYLGTREVTRAFSGDRARSFRRVVFIPYPIESSWCLAFVTAEFEVRTETGSSRMVSVFMPSTPNPTTGFYLIYPIEKVLATDLSIEEAGRMVISGGILAPHQSRFIPLFEKVPKSVR
jgi:uncharacterized membrane protein